MKKLLFLTLLAALTLGVACENGTEDAPKSVLELTSEAAVSVPAEGGNYTITYNLVTDNTAPIKAMTDNSSIITSIDSSTEGRVRVMVARNTSAESRTATVMVSYGTHCFSVTFNQAAAENNTDTDVKEIKANQFKGNFYGDRIVSNSGHFWIILTDSGFAEDGSVVRDTEFFRLDILTPYVEESDNIRIPDGIYTLDLANTLSTYTILNLGNSDYTYVDDNGEGWAYTYDSATLTVSGNKLILEASANGKAYKVTYDDDYEVVYNKLSETVSNLTSDVEIDLTNCSVTTKSFGDFWHCGYCNWQIEFIDNKGFGKGVYFVIDFLTDEDLSGASGIEGTYTAGGINPDNKNIPLFAEHCFISGHRISEDSDHLLGTLYMVYKDNACLTQAPLHAGEIRITKNGDGTHTIVVDATDDASPAHKITLNWTGTLH